MDYKVGIKADVKKRSEFIREIDDAGNGTDCRVAL